MSADDELDCLARFTRVMEARLAGHEMPERDLAVVLNRFPDLHAELIRTRQQLRAARQAADTLPLIPMPPITPKHHA